MNAPIVHLKSIYDELISMGHGVLSNKLCLHYVLSSADQCHQYYQHSTTDASSISGNILAAYPTIRPACPACAGMAGRRLPNACIMRTYCRLHKSLLKQAQAASAAERHMPFASKRRGAREAFLNLRRNFSKATLQVRDRLP